MRSIQFDTVGVPAEVLQIREVEDLSPAQGQVRIRVHVANINPSDTLFIRGMY
ncbi:MAG TPA: zinc-binding dehydrogenase, partial [Cytophagales bacterium]|nr:zinc-binding dehydrogenase [Cytophagales bacterium]